MQTTNYRSVSSTCDFDRGEARRSFRSHCGGLQMPQNIDTRHCTEITEVLALLPDWLFHVLTKKNTSYYITDMFSVLF